MTHRESTFYRNLGAVLLLGDLGLTATVFLRGIPVDKWVVIALSFGFIGGLALLRPALVNRAVKYGVSKLPGKPDDR